MKEKLSSFISSLHLRISDLFLAIGFIPMVFFLINGQLFMQYQDQMDVPLKLEAIIPLFIILLISWGIYIFLEIKRDNSISKYIYYVFIILFIIGVAGILSQPNNPSIDMVKNNGEHEIITIVISTTHRIFFTFDIISILLFVFIGLIIFPKRFSRIGFLRVVGYLVILGCFSLIIYSYINELDNYPNFIKALLDGSFGLKNVFAVKSYIIHKNAFGMALLLGIICCLINHSIEKKWWYYIIAIYFLISMVFTFCKTSLLLSPIIMLIYTYHYLIINLRSHKKRYLIAFISLSTVLLVSALFALVILIDKGNNFSSLYKIISSMSDSESINSINSREWIWSNVYQIISHGAPLSLFIGCGFGVVNQILLPMNLANDDTALSFPTHSGYLNLFAEGGFLYIFAYLTLLGYAIYISIKCFKKNPSTTIAIALGLFSFVFYSLIETIHYLTYIFMFVLFAFHNSLSTKHDVSVE